MLNLLKISFLLLVLFIPSITNQVNDKEAAKIFKDINSQSINNSSNNRNSLQEETPTLKHIIVATLETSPFMMKRQIIKDNTTVVEWYGYCIDLFNEIIKHLPYKVTYEVYQVGDNRYGSKSKQVIVETNLTSGKQTHKKIVRWNGLIGDLQHDRAHLALAPLAVMAERELVIDFTVPFYDLVGIQILLKKPEVPQDWFKFLTVLDAEVWFSITVSYFVTSFVIFLFDRLSPYSHKNITRIRKLRRDHKNHLELDESSFWKSEQRQHALFSPQYTTGLVDVNKQLDKSVISGEHLGRSHELYVGSLSNAPWKVPRKSTFLLTGFDSIDKNKSSVHHIDTLRPDEWRQGHRGSKKMNDYFRSINLKNGGATFDSDDARSDDSDDDKPDFGLRDSLWFCITSLTPQGGGEAPQNLSGRVVAGAWWLFCFIIIASYTANLAAFLTVSRLDIPIENLDDLVKQYKIKYAPVDGTAEQTYFERMAYIEEIFYNIWKEMSLNSSLSEEERSKFAVWDYPISDKYTKIWTQIQQVGLPADIETGIKRVKNSNLDDGFALLADANLVKHAVMTDCSLKSVGDEFSRKPIALGVRKGNEQFRDDLSYAILKLINQRYMEILREKWWTNNPNRLACDNNDESEGISIENIGGVFIIIFVGVTISFFVWAVERFFYKTKIKVSTNVNINY